MFKEYAESIDLDYERDDFQLRYSEKKLALANLPYHLRESLDIRARGGSKTFDTM